MHACYIIYDSNNFTYNGYTVNFERRIRQHNKEIKGGARYTSLHGPWNYLMQIESEQFTKNIALSFEWSVKYPTNKRPRPRMYNGVLGRINSIPLVLKNPKFCSYTYTIRIIDEYYEYLKDLCKEFPNVSIIPFTTAVTTQDVATIQELSMSLEELTLHPHHNTFEADV